MDYSGDYFQRYLQLDAAPMGEALTAARKALAGRHYSGELIDVGIGGGRFVEAARCYGFDVNPDAVQWLQDSGRYRDPYSGSPVSAVTCWDSLEHIPEPERLISRVTGWVFVSMPIYKSAADCLKSKHFKPGEHLHYWSLRGLIGWFSRQGFGCVEVNENESELGREGITSFAFRRFNNG